MNIEFLNKAIEQTGQQMTTGFVECGGFQVAFSLFLIVVVMLIICASLDSRR